MVSALEFELILRGKKYSSRYGDYKRIGHMLLPPWYQSRGFSSDDMKVGTRFWNSKLCTARRQQVKNIWGLQKDMAYFRCVHDTSHEDFKRWYESWHKIDGTLLSIVWEEVWEWGPEDTKSGKDNGLWRVSGANSVAASPLPTMGWEIQILFKKL